ncbi:VWA domain-containing protein [Rhodobacter sp. Har01]|uniref:vWA domain-containing protein n=1 Tax=Rhodobacter sp. Har01 TaxID=2883999 RepID=UPI001D084DF1|nr:vWA domain-containing protein [Rhodobacter sp. Har01]MCB6177752.1 VWA domain-containing protein [Rhodobacter sp. Har01]
MRLSLLPPALSLIALVAACMPAGPARPVSETAPEPVAVVMESAVADAAPSVPGRAYAGGARRGVLTAGDIDDVLNLDAFTRYVARTAPALGLPKLGLGAPVLARLAGPGGDSAPGARYTLRRPGAAQPFHEGYAGPDGRIADFPTVLGAGALGQVELRVFSDDGQEVARRTLATGSRQTVVLPESQAWTPDFLDLVLVVDTTGSMADEIAFLQKELVGATRAAARKAPGVSIRYGLVAYRDQGDDYVVKSYGFTGDGGTMAGWLRGLTADGGGDYPEAAAAALRAGLGLDWRRGKGERLLIHVADAPPHDSDAGAYLRAAKSAAGEGVQIFTLGASGVAAESEFLMRQASAATGGRYLFLTDDSGVGNAHAEPTIPCYRVTRLSALLTSVLASELSGHRQEPGGVQRQVGSPRAGVCAD